MEVLPTPGGPTKHTIGAFIPCDKAFIDKYGSYKLVTDPKFETLMQLLNNID